MGKVPPPQYEYRLKKLVLQRIRRNLFTTVSGDCLDSFGVSAVLDEAADKIAAHVHYDLFGVRGDDVKETVVVPLTWVDGLKEAINGSGRVGAWLSRWSFMRPAYREIAVTVQRYHVCPHVKTEYNACRGNLHLTYLESSEKSPRQSL